VQSTTRGVGERKQHQVIVRGAHRRPALTPEQPLERSRRRRWQGMAVHTQDGQRYACGASADRLALEEGIEARLSKCSDMPSSKSCPHRGARRAPRTTRKLWGSCAYPAHLATRTACVGIVAFSTFISKDRFGPRRKGCLTFTCGSRKRPFERLAPINGCRPTGMEEANIPDLCKRTDKWPPRSAHALAWPVWPARKSNRGVAARCGSSMLSSCVTPNGAERFVLGLASSGRISWAEDSSVWRPTEGHQGPYRQPIGCPRGALS
jgi:hypothetical protein